MKDIAERYPAFLREHADTLSETDLANYRKQQSCFERIVAAFDAPAAAAGGGPSSTMQIMELMNEMQQYGTPPKEIVENWQPPGFDPNAPMPPGMGQHRHNTHRHRPTISHGQHSRATSLIAFEFADV
jgi:peroxin-19